MKPTQAHSSGSRAIARGHGEESGRVCLNGQFQAKLPATGQPIRRLNLSEEPRRKLNLSCLSRLQGRTSGLKLEWKLAVCGKVNESEPRPLRASALYLLKHVC